MDISQNNQTSTSSQSDQDLQAEVDALTQEAERTSQEVDAIAVESNAAIDAIAAEVDASIKRAEPAFAELDALDEQADAEFDQLVLARAEELAEE